MNQLKNLSVNAVLIATIALWAATLVGCDDGETIRSTRFGEPEVSGPFLFPKISPGDSAESVIQIRNVGDGDLQLAQIDGDLSTEYTLEWFRGALDDTDREIGLDQGENLFPESITVGPDELITFVMTYTPRSDRAPAGRVYLSTNAASDALREVIIPVRGLSRTGELVVSPNHIDLGRVQVGEVATQTVTVSNIGLVAVSISEINAHGSARFSLELNGRNPVTQRNLLVDPDGDGEPGLAPGGSFDLIVVHRAEFDRPDTGELTILSDAVNEVLSVTLAANSEAPCIRLAPQDVDFGSAGIGQSSVQLVSIESCGGEGLRLDDLEIVEGSTHFIITEEARPSLPAMLPAADLESATALRPRFLLRVNFEPQNEQAYQGLLRVHTNDPYHPIVDVRLMGRGVQNECPQAAVLETSAQVRPLDVITLDGSPSVDVDGPEQQPVQYMWTVVERPAGSTARIVERFDRMNRPADGGSDDIPNTPDAKFFVDLAGTYIFELQVVDNHGAWAPSDSCEQMPARMVVTAVPEHDVHVQLVWDTPTDADQTDTHGSDVDLHFAHPNTQDWFRGAGVHDCYFANARPDWGTAAVRDDDPSLDIDDTNGAGPENINLNDPEDTDTLGAPYRIGVHYFRSSVDEFGGSETWGTSAATVRVYLFGELQYESTRNLEATNDFWEVAGLHLAEERQEVVEIDRLTQKVP